MYIVASKRLVFVMLPVLFLHCGLPGDSSDVDSIRKLNLFKSIGCVNPATGKMEAMEDTLQIYSIGDYQIYAAPMYEQSRDTLIDKEGNIIYEASWMTSVIGHSYYIFKVKDSIGLKYNSINADTASRFPVDSFVYNSTLRSTKFHQMENYHLNKSRRMSSWYDVKDDGLIEEYVVKTKSNECYSDSITHYFSKRLTSFPFSLSKELDSAKSMKLCKVRMIVNPGSKINGANAVPGMEVVIGIFESPVLNAKEIEGLVARFEKQKGVIK